MNKVRISTPSDGPGNANDIVVEVNGHPIRAVMRVNTQLSEEAPRKAMVVTLQFLADLEADVQHNWVITSDGIKAKSIADAYADGKGTGCADE